MHFPLKIKCVLHVRNNCDWGGYVLRSYLSSPYISRNWSNIFPLIVWVYHHLNLCSVLQNTHLFCNRGRFGRSRSSKVNDFDTNRKRVCDFLLVRHCDYGLTLHRFWDTATYWLKIVICPTPLSFGALALYVPYGICFVVNHKQTRVIRLSYSEDPIIVAWVVLTWYWTVTDGRTDRRTDGRNLS